MILIDGKKVDFGKFPNGEVNLNFRKFACSSASQITLKFEDNADLLNLFILKKYLDEELFGHRISLRILYMPYSRMDRINDTYAFSLKYVADFINQMNFSKVTVLEAHSDVTPALLNRCETKSLIPDLFKKYAEENGTTSMSVFFPDAGAQKRYSSYFGYPTLVGAKARDFATGKIEGFEAHGELKKGSTVVIIDDLCSRGGTFVAAAEALKKLGAGDIYLIVGHCEETVYSGELIEVDPAKRLVKKIYTTNSILSGKVDCDQISITNIY